MPCDSISKTTVELGKVDVRLLHAAAQSAGWNPAKLSECSTGFSFQGGNYYNGTLTLFGANVEERTREIKKSYSAETVKVTAKKYGWQLKQVSKYEFQAIKQTL